MRLALLIRPLGAGLADDTGALVAARVQADGALGTGVYAARVAVLGADEALAQVATKLPLRLMATEAECWSELV